MNIVSYSQFSEEYYKYSKLYPDADLVRLNAKTDIVIKEVKGEIEIESSKYVEDIYINASAAHYSKQSLPFSSFYTLKNIQGSAYYFSNGKYKEYKVKDFKIKDDLSGDAFYDDYKTVNFIYSNLQEGSKTELLFEQEIKDPHLLAKVFIGTYVPTINSSLTISVDKDIELGFLELNTDTIDINFNKFEKNGKVIYSWTAKNIGSYESEPNSISMLSVVPHVIPYIKSYNSKGEKIELLNNINGLYNWYYNLTKNVNKSKPDAELVNITTNLIKDKKTEDEKVRAIYYWVQQNIKYVAFEDGLGGFVPREANDVFKKKYGDCKDNSSILKEMLDIAGIKSYLTWIGTRDIPYNYNEVHTPAVDNHMILTYISSIDTCFLDATSRYQKLELPTEFIQGKEALISLNNEDFSIIKVPVIEAEKNFIHDSVKLIIDGEKLKGEATTNIGGYYKILFFNKLENKKSDDELKEFYNLNFQKGNNKFLITDFKEYNKFNYDNDFKIEYSFNVDDYIHSITDEIYVNLNLSKDFLNYKIKKEDKLDKDFLFKIKNEFVNILTLPEGYMLEYLPEDLKVDNPKYKANISYSFNGTQIIYKHNIEMNYLILKYSEFEDFNDFIKTLDKYYKESVVLKKTK